MAKRRSRNATTPATQQTANTMMHSTRVTWQMTKQRKHNWQRRREAQTRGATTTRTAFRWRRSKNVATALRAISIGQVEEFFRFMLQEMLEQDFIDDNPYSSTHNQAISEAILNMYHCCTFFVKPLSKPFQCSFQELVAEVEQLPLWFCSHAWSTALRDTVAMLKWHKECHDLTPGEALYWVCTIANNQWQLGELSGRVED